MIISCWSGLRGHHNHSGLLRSDGADCDISSNANGGVKFCWERWGVERVEEVVEVKEVLVVA